MPYQKVEIKNCTAEQQEILIAILSQQEFDSFEQLDTNLLAFTEDNAEKAEEKVKQTLQNLGWENEMTIELSLLPEKNWNKIWEKNFKPVSIKDRVNIRASFHEPSGLEYEIEINPEMAFGTGHHATTSMMIALMLEIELKGFEVMDFGCGTSILSIFAEMRGAKSVYAIDNEINAVASANKNVLLNKCKNISIAKAEIAETPENQYDLILANINKNIIFNNFSEIVRRMRAGATLLVSGVMHSDAESLEQQASGIGLARQEIMQNDNWIAVKYKRQ